jgi:hypothetical protein
LSSTCWCMGRKLVRKNTIRFVIVLYFPSAHV